MDEMDWQVLKQHGYDLVKNPFDIMHIGSTRMDSTGTVEMEAHMKWYELNGHNHPDGVPILNLKRYEHHFTLSLALGDTLRQVATPKLENRRALWKAR